MVFDMFVAWDMYINKDTHGRRINKSILEVCVLVQELLPDVRGIGYVTEEGYVEWVVC